ncbi:MAG TPA: hypothetical protein VGU01_02430 [Sphingomicrobium sp.]|nr:hypothetical protein [Sphingomicrobium sp.]
MKLVPIFMAAMLLGSPCAAARAGTDDDRILPFGCRDLVVVGRLKNLTFEPLGSGDDLIGRGSISATLRVRRIVRGGPVPRVLRIRYLAHTYMREDQDFMLVLKPTGAGYEISMGQLMSIQPRLASRCH